MQDREERQEDGGDAEGDDSIACSAVNRPEDETTEQGSPCPEDEDTAPMSMAEGHKSMMEMTLVGVGNSAARTGPPNDGEQCVDNRDPENHQRNEQRGEEEE